MSEPHDVDRVCLAYLDAYDRRDLAGMRAVRWGAGRETAAAIDEMLDWLIEEGRNPGAAPETVDAAFHRNRART